MAAEHSGEDVFCRVAAGDEPAVRIYETDDHVGILAHSGNTRGFSVVFPRDGRAAGYPRSHTSGKAVE